MKTKEEVIKEAYGDFYEPNKDLICLKNGCVTKYIARRIQEKGLSMSECPTKNDSFLPSSIKYLNTNNGWIRVESEDDLPKEDGYYWVYDVDKSIDIRFYASFSKRWEEYDREFYVPKITHYQPIVKPKEPLY